jgi:hypothetical protein
MDCQVSWTWRNFFMIQYSGLCSLAEFFYVAVHFRRWLWQFLHTYISNHLSRPTIFLLMQSWIRSVLCLVSICSYHPWWFSSITYTFVHPDSKKPKLRGAEILIPATWGDDPWKAIYSKLRSFLLIKHNPTMCVVRYVALASCTAS